MEEKDFEVRLGKLSHDIEQLDAKIDDKISSVEEKLKRDIMEANLTGLRDISQIYITIASLSEATSSEKYKRAYFEIAKLIDEYMEELDKVSADEFDQRHPSVKEDINRITRTVGVGNIWRRPKD